ncbi:hypothetical protein [Lichenibacterium dinghuense]|uniref:hypothetical protein n=1 Tax=Lichenibacterium dinghuense TaxID=2895977 RepID=UPI001F3C48D6|nr:hypothetical protein [Lichenibacterium sp. 6Y81]
MAVGLRDACRDAYVKLRRGEGVRGLPDGRLRDSATCDDVGTDHAGDMKRLFPSGTGLGPPSANPMQMLPPCVAGWAGTEEISFHD